MRKITFSPLTSAAVAVVLTAVVTTAIASASSPKVRYETEESTLVREVELPEPEVITVEKIVEIEVPVTQTVEVEVPVEVIVEKTVEVPVEVLKWVSAEDAPREPLTGLQSSYSVVGPAVAVKIPNNYAARPQVGLTAADVVFEEVINDSLTRFLAVFQSELPSTVGPIRSSREQDIAILSAFSSPIFMHSGANDTVTSLLAGASDAGLLTDASYLSTAGYWRGDDRPAPHNLYSSVSAMADRFDGVATPTAVFTYSDLISGLPNTRAQFSMDSIGVDWTYDASAGNYVRRQNDALHIADGEAVTATNVVIMNVWYGLDPLTPVAHTVGSGDVTVMRNGTMVHGTWSRATATDPFVFTSDSGQEIPLAAGNTWVELLRLDEVPSFNVEVGPCSLANTVPSVTLGNCIPD